MCALYYILRAGTSTATNLDSTIENKIIVKKSIFKIKNYTFRWSI